MKRLVVLLFLSIIVLLSGCVEQEIPTITTSPKDGVVIKKFWFDNSNIYEQDRTILNLELQNIGEVEATGIRAILFGPDWIPSATTTTTLHLSPSEPEVQIEGGSRIIKWTLTAPIVETEINYDIGTRVIYYYRTVYTGTLRLIKDVYLETLTEEERSGLLEKNGVVSSKVTGGPLSVSPVKGRNFVISSTSAGTGPIVFELTNPGSGYPSYPENIDVHKYKVRILSQTGLTNCDSYGLRENGNRIVKLSKGKSRLFSCDFDIDEHIRISGPIINKQDIVFSVTFDYYYYVDGIASIIVNPLLGV